MIVVGHEIRIARLPGFHRGVLPRAAMARRLAKAPKVIGLAQPEACFALDGFDGLAPLRFHFGPGQDQKSPPCAVIADRQPVGADRTHAYKVGVIDGLVGGVPARDLIKSTVPVASGLLYMIY